MSHRSSSAPARVATRSRQLLLAAFTALLLVLGAGFSSAASALEPGNGAFTGTLTVGGAPLREGEGWILALTYDPADDYWYVYDYAPTDATGRYSLELPADTYRLCYEPNDAEFASTCEGARDVWNATDFTLASGQVRTVNHSFTAPARISGTVTAASAGPVADVWVGVFQDTGGSWDAVAYRQTDSNGTYVVPVEAGSYRVSFEDSGTAYATEYWDNASTIEGGTTLALAAGQQRTGVDAILEGAGTIAGHVTDTSGTSLADINVAVYQWDASRSRWEHVGGTITDTDGSYVVTAPSGDIRIGFDDYLDNQYVAEYWDDALSLDDATTIAVTGGSAVTGTDAVLVKGASIAGTVTVPDGMDPSAVEVEAYDSIADYGRTVEVDADGAYRIDGLPAGDYEVHFAPYDGSALVAEWYDDQPTAEAADSVAVSAGQVRTGIDATLAVDATPTPVLANTSKPAISDTTPQVGQVLTAAPGTWSQSDATYAYQWLRGGTPIAGATSSKYTVAAADEAKALTVQVTASKTGYDAGVATSDPTSPVAAAPVSPSPLVPNGPTLVYGNAAPGGVLIVSNGSWRVTPTQVSYQWYADGVAIPGATTSTFTIPTGYAGRGLSAVVTASALPEYTAGQTGSNTVTVAYGSFSVSGAPAIYGTARKGHVLVASTASVSPAPEAVSYQWRRNGVDIPGATGASYKLTKKDKRKRITVVVTYARPDYGTVVQVSAPTRKVK